MLRGWRVLARNYRTNNGEIDLIAARGSVVAFVEVKARPGLEEARTAITHEKRRRISKAAAHWLARNGWAMGYTLRGDAIFIAPRRLPEHAVDVFALELM
jgi:putative endonuclease